MVEEWYAESVIGADLTGKLGAVYVIHRRFIDPDSEKRILYCKAEKATCIIRTNQFLDEYHNHI